MDAQNILATLTNPRATRLRWAAFLAAAGLFLVGSIFMQFRLEWLTALLALSAVSASILAALAARLRRPVPSRQFLTALLFARITIDLLLLLTAIRVTGGIESPFLFLLVAYLFMVDLEAGARVGLIASLSALLALGVNAYLEFIHVLPHLLIGLPFETTYSSGLFNYVTFAFIAGVIYIGLNNLRQITDQLRAREANLSKTTEQLTQRVNELTVLRQIGEQLTASLNLETVLDTITHSVLHLVKANDVHIFPYDQTKDEFGQGIAAWSNPSHNLALTPPRENGLTRTVARRKEPVLIDNIDGHPLFTETETHRWNLRSIGGFPLKKAERVVGVMNITFQTPHTFTEDERVLLMALADQAALAIDNATLYAQVERRARELAALYETSRTTAQFLAPAELLDRALVSALQVIDAPIGMVFLTEEDCADVSLAAQRGLAYLTVAALRERPLSRSDHLVASALTKGAPQVIRVDGEAAPLDARFKNENLRSIIVVPLSSKDHVLGAFALAHRKPVSIDDADVSLLSAICQQLAVSLENTRLYDAARRRAEELQSLLEIGLALTRTLDLREQLRLLHVQVQRVIQAETFFVGLYDEARREIHVEFAVEEGWELRGITLSADAPGLTSWVIQTRRPLRVEDMEKERNTLPVPPRHETRPARSWLGVPLMIQDRVSGVLSVQSFKPHAFSASDERFLIAVGQHAALALENARLYETAAQRARELELMNQVHRTLTASLDPDDIFRKAARGLADTLGYSHITLYAYQEDQLTLKTQIGYARQDWDHALAGRAARSAQTALARAARPDADSRAALGAIKQIAAPIRRDQRVLGVLAIEARGEASLTDEDVRTVTSFADYLGIAIANAAMYQSAVERDRVLTNALTAVRS